MARKTEPDVSINTQSNKLNLDMHDYIIMRKGIEPIWEDPKNSDGGTFTIKMAHTKGYDIWSLFIMYMMGETLTRDMGEINGITVSYISDSNSFHNPNAMGNGTYTYLKIWDGKSNRTKDQFIDILPDDLYEQIKTESLMYSSNNTKKHFNEANIIGKLKKNRYDRDGDRNRGGFVTGRRRY